MLSPQDTNKRLSIHINDGPRGSWASSIFDLNQSQADTLLPNLFDRISKDDVDRNNENLRQQNRYDNLFSLYPAEFEVNWINHYTIQGCEILPFLSFLVISQHGMFHEIHCTKNSMVVKTYLLIGLLTKSFSPIQSQRLINFIVIMIL